MTVNQDKQSSAALLEQENAALKAQNAQLQQQVDYLLEYEYQLPTGQGCCLWEVWCTFLPAK